MEGLTNEPAPSRANGQADRELLLTRRSPGQHQVGNAHASRQQNQTGQNHHRGERLRKLHPQVAQSPRRRA
jgi:hypothetical protein